MMDEMNHLTLGDTPEGMVENDDGSVDVLDVETTTVDTTEFLVNLAESLPTDTLNHIAGEYIEHVERDKKSREKRDEQYRDGLRRSGLGDDAPGGAEFNGASRVVHPVLAEACIDFASRAIKELFPATGPVKAWVTDDITPKQLEQATRKARFMNWQLTTQIKEYRDELEQLLTQVPMGGSQYQKFWYDDRLKRPRSEFIPVDEVYLPFAATNFYTAQRVTHRQMLTRFEFNRRVDSGLYRDVFAGKDVGVVSDQFPEQSRASKANDKIEGREEDGYNEDGLRAILEIYTWLEIEGDEISGGDFAPYILTIDEDTEEVLSIYRNWKEGDATLEKLDWFVEYKFIPWRGAYGIGLPHLIGGLSAGLTGALRALLDSAHINNAPSMLKLKSGRVVGQNTQVNITEVTEIEAPAGITDIRQIAMPMPFNQPSDVLYRLMQDLYGMAKGVIATAEDQLGKVGDRTPVGTTMALIEQGSQTYSAIHSRLHASQRKALEILHRIDQDYLDEIVEFEGQSVTREDFAGTSDVIPVSDPTIFSEAQRFAQTQAILQMAQADQQNPNVPWNQVAVRRRILKQMRIDGIDELLPPVKQPMTSTVVEENAEAMEGTPIKAHPQQEHMAHIQGHLAFISSPLQLQNPLIPPQLIQALLVHIGEHIRMLESVTTAELIRQQGLMSDEQTPVAIGQAQELLAQQLLPVMQQIAKIQQVLQQRAPQPQMPPEVQAQLQIAQMDTQRKTQYDQALIQLKQQESQVDQQVKGASMQAEMGQQQFEQQLAMQELQFKQQVELANQQIEQLKQQVELMKNDAKNRSDQETHLMMNHEDNLIKQRTDLEMNHEDNITKLIIADIQAKKLNEAKGEGA